MVRRGVVHRGVTNRARRAAVSLPARFSNRARRGPPTVLGAVLQPCSARASNRARRGPPTVLGAGLRPCSARVSDPAETADRRSPTPMRINFLTSARLALPDLPDPRVHATTAVTTTRRHHPNPRHLSACRACPTRFTSGKSTPCSVNSTACHSSAPAVSVDALKQRRSAELAAKDGPLTGVHQPMAALHAESGTDGGCVGLHRFGRGT